MKQKYFNTIAIFGAVAMAIPAILFAANVFDIEYPIAALQNCASREECKAFCNAPENEVSCFAWAQENGFAPKPQPIQEIKDEKEPNSEKDANEPAPIDDQTMKDTPGKCKTPRECGAYCRVNEHLKECLQYSVKYGYTTQEKADKILAQSKKGGPGGCRGPEECDAFCKQPENTRACMKFAVDEGKITQEEAELVTAQMEKNRVEGKKPIEENESDEPRQRQTKAQEILQKKTGPGGCKNRQECAAFCDKEENHETCVTFSKENGLLNEEEIKMAEKQMSLLQKLEKQGGGPGGCKTRQECDAFCKDQNNVETCIQFAAKQGMLSPEKMGQMMGQTIEAKQRIEGVGQYQMMMNGTISSEKMIPPPRENTPNNRLPIPISGQICPNGNCEQNMNESSSTSNEQRERLQQRVNEIRPVQTPVKDCKGENCGQTVNEVSPSQGEAPQYEQSQQVHPQEVRTQYRQPPQGIQYPMPPEGFRSESMQRSAETNRNMPPPPPTPPAPQPVSVAFQNLLASVAAFFLGK